MLIRGRRLHRNLPPALWRWLIGTRKGAFILRSDDRTGLGS